MKRLLFAICCFLLLYSCSKKVSSDLVNETNLSDWLFENGHYRVVEPTTGTIVFDAAEVKLDGKPVSNAGIYFFRNSSAPHQFPTIKQLNSHGYTRDIELGNSTNWCDNYRSTSANVQLRIISGDKMFITQTCPVLLLEHETLPSQINWTVPIPRLIEVKLSGKK
jgi:hypothetical protein